MNAASLVSGLPMPRLVWRPRRMPLPDRTVDLLRVRGIVAITGAAWASLTALIIANLWLGKSATGALLAVGLLANILPTLMAVQRRYDAEARTIVGTLAAVMPALLVYSLRGHPWQMDGHMYFFVGLAMLTVLCDWRPIAVASALIAAHHLLFEYLAPAWVFAGVGNIERIVFHALAVAIQFGVLGFITSRLEALLQEQDMAVEESRRLVDAAERERQRASEALHTAQAAEQAATAERAQRQAVEERLAIERQAELNVLASEFERTVSTVVKSIEDAASQLAGSSTDLSDIAAQAGKEAGDVALGVAAATVEIRQVAHSLQHLSTSIGTIAVTAEHQDRSTTKAYHEGRESGETITELLDQTGRIGGFVDAIRSIAAKTNMLALNATIEAARAGAAGQGFVVVAAEVKNLAAEAARASDEIAALLDNIRSAVGHSAAGVESVVKSVRQVSEGAAEIAAVVADQRSHTADIEGSASRASSGADLIERRIGHVAQAVAAASTLSDDVRTSAGALSKDAAALRSSTDMFVSFLRVAQ